MLPVFESLYRHQQLRTPCLMEGKSVQEPQQALAICSITHTSAMQQ